MEINEGMDARLLKLTASASVFERQQLKEDLIDYINLLLLNDFNKLVQLLYRVDVNEEKLKTLIKDNPQTDAAVVIADLLICRQEEKAKARESLPGDKDIPEDEKW